VTDVSGRGVGMDVVKKNITALGGTVEIDSAEGYGMTVSRAPAADAGHHGRHVGGRGRGGATSCRCRRWSSRSRSSRHVKTIGGSGRVVKVRDEYMPVIALERVFEVPRFDFEHVQQHHGGGRGRRRPRGLLVDELLGQQQVVVKNLEANYRKVDDVSGATILGDGRVA
jgi:two-component system chemotaxis sensor kinase CheA